LKLVTCPVQARIEKEIGNEETLIVSQWREETDNIRFDYYLAWRNEKTDIEEYG
jgi:hypothetical protein